MKVHLTFIDEPNLDAGTAKKNSLLRKASFQKAEQLQGSSRRDGPRACGPILVKRVLLRCPSAEMRSSPRFAQRVREIARTRGEKVDIATH